MGKYSQRSREGAPKEDMSKSFGWRSIGCALMIVIPAISIVGALVTIDSSLVVYIPEQLMGYPVLPDYLFATDGLSTIFSPIVNTENLYAIALISTSYMILIGGIVSLIYAIVYRIINPNRYGEFDAPPPNVKTKKYKR